jgi:hypothetical protein
MDFLLKLIIGMARNLLFLCAALITNAQASFDCGLFDTQEAYGEGALRNIQSYMDETKDEAKFDL